MIRYETPAEPVEGDGDEDNEGDGEE